MIRKNCWIGLLLIPLAGCSRMGDLTKAQTSFHQTADVQGVHLAVIETRNGSVEVENSQAGGPADISGSKYAHGTTLQQAQERLDQIEIRVEREAGHSEVLHIVADFKGLKSGSPGASFHIALPPEVELGIFTSNASITTNDRHKNVKAETSNGAITVGKIDGNVVLTSSNAPVTARHVRGDVQATSSNGSIQLEHVGSGRVTATTSNASITALQPQGELSLVSSNGSITLKSANPHSRVNIHTSNAGVHVILPKTTQAAVSLETSNASVQTNLGGAQVTETRSNKGSFSAILNGGGAGRINAETSNGSIHFDLTEPPLQPEKP